MKPDFLPWGLGRPLCVIPAVIRWAIFVMGFYGKQRDFLGITAKFAKAAADKRKIARNKSKTKSQLSW